jgi:hypothetical protein
MTGPLSVSRKTHRVSLLAAEFSTALKKKMAGTVFVAPTEHQ